MSSLEPTWIQPSHLTILEIIKGHSEDPFSSSSRSRLCAAPGALLVALSSPTLTLSKKAYSTVQISRKQHVELNADFLYLNHSCEPSLELHVVPRTRTQGELLDVQGTARDVPVCIEVRVARRRNADGDVVGLEVRDEMTFFYPSTEWEMAQPFECTCGAESCRGLITGAKDMPAEKLEGFFLNSHILQMLEEIHLKV